MRAIFALVPLALAACVGWVAYRLGAPGRQLQAELEAARKQEAAMRAMSMAASMAAMILALGFGLRHLLPWAALMLLTPVCYALSNLFSVRFAVRGTPTDCVIMGVRRIMRDNPPDLVLSGVNVGHNLAEDVTYSGTIAAAMEGTLLGVPSIALSPTMSAGVLMCPYTAVSGPTSSDASTPTRSAPRSSARRPPVVASSANGMP